MADFQIDLPDGAMPPPPRGGATGGSRNAASDWQVPPPPVEIPAERGGRAPRVRWSRGLLSTTWLLVYGESGLTPAAHKNLATAAFLLAALWFIDAVAWFGLWNLLLTRSLMEIQPLSILAGILGLLIATSILYYESSFLTADLGQSARPAVSIAIRLSLILVISLATSLPVDMYLLEDQINGRIHEEQVLQQLPGLVQRWEQANAKISGTVVTNAEQLAQTVVERGAVKEAAGERERLESERSILLRHIDSQRRQVIVLENGLAAATEDEQVERIAPLVRSARRALESLRARDRQLLASVAGAQARERETSRALAIKDARINADQVRDATAEATRYETWVHDLWNAAPRTVVQERIAAPDRLAYDGASIEGSVGIGERLIVLADLLAGAPPRRPRMSGQDQLALKEMKLAAFVEDDQEGIRRQQSEARSLWRLVSLSFVGFAFMPFMILALKFLFDRDTQLYFDSTYQRRLGNPDLPAAFEDNVHASGAGVTGAV